MKTLPKLTIFAALTLGVCSFGSAASASTVPESPSSNAAALAAEACGPGNTVYTQLEQTRVSGNPTCGFWYYVQLKWSSNFGYTGAQNGVMGPNSWKGVQRYLNAGGAGLVVDGQAGPATNRAIQVSLRREVAPSLAVDGVRGPATYRAWATQLQGAG